MKVKTTLTTFSLICDECGDEVGPAQFKDKLYHYGSECICVECLIGRHDEVDIDEVKCYGK